MPLKVPASLVRHLNEGRCVLFVGAGLSAQAKLPSWGKLLGDLVQQVGADEPEEDSTAELKKLLDAGRFLDVADECKERLGAGYAEHLSRALQVGAGPVPEAHRLVMQLPFAAWITTNYDKLLEQAHFQVRGSVPKTLTHLDADTFGTLLFDGAPFILKAHGDVDKPESLIFTTRDYREIIHSNPAFQAVFSAILLTRAVLFVGYSLNDPDFRLLLDRQLTMFKKFVPERYAIMAGVGDVEREVLRRTAQIKVISYPTDQHGQLVEFLRALQAQVLTPPSAKTVPGSGPRPASAPSWPASALTATELFADLEGTPVPPTPAHVPARTPAPGNSEPLRSEPPPSGPLEAERPKVAPPEESALATLEIVEFNAKSVKVMGREEIDALFDDSVEVNAPPPPQPRASPGGGGSGASKPPAASLGNVFSAPPPRARPPPPASAPLPLPSAAAPAPPRPVGFAGRADRPAAGAAPVDRQASQDEQSRNGDAGGPAEDGTAASAAPSYQAQPDAPGATRQAAQPFVLALSLVGARVVAALDDGNGDQVAWGGSGAFSNSSLMKLLAQARSVADYRQVGRELTESLHAGVLKALERYLGTASAPSLILQLDVGLESRPWELMEVLGKPLALQAAVSRAPVGLTPAARGRPMLRKPIRALLVGDPAGNLPGARAEVEALARLYHKPIVLIGDDASAENISDVTLPGCDVIHFAGHAWYDAQDMYLVLPGDTHLSGDLIRPGLSQRPPCVVMLNSHYTAFVPPGVGSKGPDPMKATSGGRMGFTEAAMRAGVGVFVGCFGSPSDVGGAAMALAFHRALLSGVPAAEALRRARNAATVPQDDPTPLLYALSGYGDLSPE